MTFSANEPSPINERELRSAFGTFLTGITVVTMIDGDGNPRGITANSFTSVSLDPPLLLVCVGNRSFSFPAFCDTQSFAVNLLHEGQADVSSLFASKSSDKFQSVPFGPGITGAPILADCLTWFDCTVHDRVMAGDHLILIGRVQAFGTTPSAPLGFCRGRYTAAREPLAAGRQTEHGVQVGYLVEADDGILLQSDGTGGWRLPGGRSRKAESALSLGDGGLLPLRPDDTFLYSVFDIPGQDAGCLVYRARLAPEASAAGLPPDVRVFALDALPFEAIPTREARAMLRRYVRERQADRFGIYIDSGDGGRLAMVDGRASRWSHVVTENA
ncbi:flavin reductase family protein [Azospirillum canadense]|uniref:flavin reductase family protein n=1 Tax=Azospirillum canadense TaxID=403962 RepID=UPI0022280620|nr:flavin reductase [Azospirillum canadense]MCW2241078.1 flavin reductase (DIM6/NTAB) family NADH-FMN oxidoreductase RutF [Azospirillum canadense]